MRECLLTNAEALVMSVVATLAAVIAIAYLWGRVGSVSPFAILGFAIASAIVVALWLLRRSTRETAAIVGALGVAALVAGWLLWLARPSFLLPGSGPDLTHHLVLLDYTERHWQLPDSSHIDAMGEMAHYTPGLHLMAALAGSWTRSDGFHAIYPLVAATVALKCALVFLIALRLMPAAASRIPMALSAVVFAMAPQAYFLGSFTHDSFLAQVFAEMFAVAMWWAIVVWDARPARLPMMLFAATGVGAFLSWPIWIGPPVVVLAAAVVARGDIPVRDRLRDLTIAIVPIAAVAAAHAAGRIGWLRMAATSGAVLSPSVDAFGFAFAIASVAGIVVSAFQRHARTTLVLVIAIGGQAATLYAIARSANASTPYMAFKMFYLLIYPLAVLAAVAIAMALDRGLKAIPTHPQRTYIAWIFLLIVVVAYREPLTTVKLPAPVVSENLYVAGRWSRANLEAACVDYLVPHAHTAYWLHLAVLGNPRSTPRTADPDTFEPARNVARWIQPDGLPYAIAHLPTLPNEVFTDVDVLERFGTAAVVTRRGPASCPDAQRLARATP